MPNLLFSKCVSTHDFLRGDRQVWPHGMVKQMDIHGRLNFSMWQGKSWTRGSLVEGHTEPDELLAWGKINGKFLIPC